MESLHYLLMKTHSLFSKLVMTEASHAGLTSGQPKVLEYLTLFGEADQKTIAAYCEIEPATVGSILLRMEENGLILRRQKAGNRRSLYVSLTDKGRDAAARVEEIFHTVEADAARELSPDEVHLLQELLNKLCTGLQPNANFQKKKESV